ncbi:Phosphoribosylglycinamide formyltransferase [Smittium culicis]|uniref:phosphoribosylglycinamide formyltransferase 1 n=1 Tax=Smittium culicis TaxID=133412 RepID=A0A1R1X5M4_9FUNG|nr:Phosphoribosylglycinamide formyltransferase [Smittium culicis]
MSKRIVVLISGNGSNLQALIDGVEAGNIPGKIVRVISSSEKAYGLERARNHGIATDVLTLAGVKRQGLSRDDYNLKLADLVRANEPDLVVLAGFMLILSPEFVDAFSRKLINLHPALPGDIEGAHAIDRAYEEFLAGKRDHTGVMVHHVVAQVDRGEPILSEKVMIQKGDTLEDLENRIHAVEHLLLPKAVTKLLESNL